MTGRVYIGGVGGKRKGVVRRGEWVKGRQLRVGGKVRGSGEREGGGVKEGLEGRERGIKKSNAVVAVWVEGGGDWEGCVGVGE